MMSSSMEDINNMNGQVTLPGFRFHPTEEELLDFYLKNMVSGKKLRFDVIGFLNIYHHHPWDLPGLAKVGEREWYFFVPRDKKHGTGGRPNRTTEKGFWKATGSDRKIVTLSDPKRIIGLRKTLVFYEGRAPKGCKTDWVMNEYRLPDNCSLPKDIVLCKIYRKATSLKVLEQRAAMQEEMEQMIGSPDESAPSSTDTVSLSNQQQEDYDHNNMPLFLKKETEVAEAYDQKTTLTTMSSVPKQENNTTTTTTTIHQLTPIKENKKTCCGTSIQLPLGKDNIPELQLPMMITSDWTQDTFWAQLNSPWLQNWTPNYSNILNF